MADQADDIRQAIKKGRQDIADTRSAIAEKLTVLEDRIQKTVNGVKDAFDPHYQVKQHPWLMFGGSLLVGYTLGHRGNVSGTTADAPSEPATHAPPHQSGESAIRSQVKNDVATIKGAAFGAIISTLWAMTKQMLLPPDRQADDAIINPTAQRLDSSQQISKRVIASQTNGKHEL